MRVLPIQSYQSYSSKPISINRKQVVTRTQPADVVVPSSVAFGVLLVRDVKMANWIKTVRNGCAGFGFTENVIKAISERCYLRNKDYSPLMNEVRDRVIKPDFLLLSSFNKKEYNEMVLEEWFLAAIPGLMILSDTLGDDSLKYALANMKSDAFRNFMQTVSKFKLSAQSPFVKALMLRTNPGMTNEAKDLTERISEARKLLSKENPKNKGFWRIYEKNHPLIVKCENRISELKKNFSAEAKKEIKALYAEIKALRAEINSAKSPEYIATEGWITELSAKLHKLLALECKDPQNKLRAFELFDMAASYSWTDGVEPLFELIDTKTPEDRNRLNEFLKDSMLHFMPLSAKAKEGFKRLNIDASPYAHKLVQQALAENRNNSNHTRLGLDLPVYLGMSEKDFGTNFEVLLELAAINAPLARVLDKLPANIETQYMFNSKNLDYNVWTGFDAEHDVMEFEDGLVIKKVDMNDVKHSLFLGNQSNCCTRIGTGSRAKNAPLYIMNKFIQAIEIYDGDQIIGNTMCYMAEANDKLMFVLDNIEVLKPYNENPKVRKALIKFSENFVQRVAGREIPIYAGNRNKIDFSKEGASLGYYFFGNLRVIGSSNGENMSIDSIGVNAFGGENKYSVNFYALTECPKGKGLKSFTESSANSWLQFMDLEDDLYLYD